MQPVHQLGQGPGAGGRGAPVVVSKKASGCANLTGRWVGSWHAHWNYSLVEDAGHEVSICSDLKADCWSAATGQRKGLPPSYSLRKMEDWRANCVYRYKCRQQKKKPEPITF